MHKGSNNNSAKLTEEDVIKIKMLLKNGEMTQKEIAKIYNVSSVCIGSIKRNETWSFIKI